MLLDPGAHGNVVYELTGDTAWTMADLDRPLSEVLDRDVAYRNVFTEEHIAALTSAGLDPDTAGFVAALDTNTRDGELALVTDTLARLIGRPTTPIGTTLRANAGPAPTDA